MQGPSVGWNNTQCENGGRVLESSNPRVYFQTYRASSARRISHSQSSSPQSSRDGLTWRPGQGTWELPVPPGMTWPVPAREPGLARGLCVPCPALCASQIPGIRFDAAPSAIPAPTRP